MDHETETDHEDEMKEFNVEEELESSLIILTPPHAVDQGENFEKESEVSTHKCSKFLTLPTTANGANVMGQTLQPQPIMEMTSSQEQTAKKKV